MTRDNARSTMFGEREQLEGLLREGMVFRDSKKGSCVKWR